MLGKVTRKVGRANEFPYQMKQSCALWRAITRSEDF
jgi:hypothetical protein